MAAPLLSREGIENAYAHHPPPNEAIAGLHMGIREETKALAHYYFEYGVPCRELVIALRKLEEAMFYANASIARNHQVFTEAE